MGSDGDPGERELQHRRDRYRDRAVRLETEYAYLVRKRWPEKSEVHPSEKWRAERR
ncbi:hypothetical protein [Amycolatopsis sp. NPDC004625]|uniref:hypothetical protein n=1 Tax=Amycolatopsis sp. NPDC004625 TaxID=3154670 RepID=UPI0033A0C44C